MCWHHDIQLQIKAANGIAPKDVEASLPAPSASAVVAAQPRLTDIALLVGNLYGAGSRDANPAGAHQENSGC